MYYSLLICLLELYFERKVAACLKVKEKVVRVQTTPIESIEEILSAYSGRRLQYAIKFGMLPTPESLKKLLERKTNTANGINNRAIA